MTQAAKGAATRLAGSSTFLYGILGIAAYTMLGRWGVEIPWELAATAVGAYGVKEGLKGKSA
jgi:hypothetical protein